MATVLAKQPDLLQPQTPFGSYEQACRDLAAFTDFHDVKTYHDKARALEEYAKRAKDALALEAAVRIRYEAVSHMGRVIIEMQQRGELRDTKPSSKPKAKLPPGEAMQTLEKLGVTWKQSSNAQWWFRLPQSERERRTTSICASLLRSLNAVFRQRMDDERKDELYSSVDIIPGLHVGDFRDLSPQMIEASSIELVFTDPPYDRDSLPLFGAAAAEAKRILKPGGSLITYAGNVAVPDVISAMSEHLDYFWLCACVHAGDHNRIFKKGIVNVAKPMLWYVNGYRGDVQTFVRDAVSGGQEKSHHDWQQSEEEARYYISLLTSPTGTVVDFFVGGGTTIAVADQLGRRWHGFEIDPLVAQRAAARVAKRANP